jgi:hypothetical protein
MDARCNGDTCSVLKTQSYEDSMECNVPQVSGDDVDGCKLLFMISLKAWLTTSSGVDTLPGDRMLF